VATYAAAQNTPPNLRPRASDLGLKVGVLPSGPLNAMSPLFQALIEATEEGVYNSMF